MKFVKKEQDLLEEKNREETMKSRKLLQKEHEKDLDMMRLKLNKELRESDSKDIYNEEYDKNWKEILKYKSEHGGDFNLDKALNPEAEKEETDPKKVNKNEKDKNNKAKKKKKSKNKET